MKKGIVFITFLGLIIIFITLYFSSEVVRQFVHDCLFKLEEMVAGIQGTVEKIFG